MNLTELSRTKSTTKQNQHKVDNKVVVEKQENVELTQQLALLGIDPSSKEYADTVAELKLIKRANPQLYRKALGLN